MSRLVRNPDLLLGWKGPHLFIEDLRHKQSSRASSPLVAVLDLFAAPCSAIEAARRLPGFERGSVVRTVRALARAGLLMPAADLRKRPSLVESWKGNLGAAIYHVASRDRRYLRSRIAVDRFLAKKLLGRPRPAPFKRYARKPLLRLPPTGSLSRPARSVGSSPNGRTVREFSARPVALDDLSLVLGGTWGRTGWLDGGALGPLVTKTSPSAGALHPIECYVLAWNVAGLAPGLYHYDVPSHGLRRLRRGDFRADAVEAASGQSFVGRGGVRCVMTAVFSRTLWKYEDEIDLQGALARRGAPGPDFLPAGDVERPRSLQTAALQDSFIESLIGLDGVSEFPLYMCGAGVPAKRPGSAELRSAGRPARRGTRGRGE